MEHRMITSASGWRKVFAVSGDEKDTTQEIGQENTAVCALSALAFARRILLKNKNPRIALGCDTRPTGKQMSTAVIKALIASGVKVYFTGITAAPEIMAFARGFDGFVYISASHNPVGHNGIKFGYNDGGVLDAQENALITSTLNELCAQEDALKKGLELIQNCPQGEYERVIKEQPSVKKEALKAYSAFIKEAVWDTKNTREQENYTDLIKNGLRSVPVEIACDMNGSARTLSIDKDFLPSYGINLNSINALPGQIAHEIIPEPENLVYCASYMEKLHSQGNTNCLLGYMPDCDGDRGNIVYWDEKLHKASVLKAQEVFALCVLSELAWSVYTKKNQYLAVAVNCPTSMRIEEIAGAFNAEVFRAEVGEANVVNLARRKRSEGYTVRILGEGSNGGNITHPSAVRDPLCTVWALLKLLLVKDEQTPQGLKKGLFHLWCSLSGQEEKFSSNATLRDIINTLPVYTTTGVSEKRAVLKITSPDHSILKKNFQEIFKKEWTAKKEELDKLYGITSYEAVRTNGTEEVKGISDYGSSAKGGLKIIFKDSSSIPQAFIWMRGSGTEPVFRVMCDFKGNNSAGEKALLEWETKMLLEADKQ